MTSLFSSFDCSYWSLGKTVTVVYALSLLYLNWNTNQMKMVYDAPFKVLGSFFLSLKSSNFDKAVLMMLMALFSWVLIFNLLGLYSYNFSVTSQMSMVLFFALSFWTGLLLCNSVLNLKGLMHHFIPEGSPVPLVPVLFVIELVSNIIRPITLTVRLVANILAGHLLMILLSEMVFSIIPTFITYVLLNLVEMFVSIIQAYIFCTMACLYYSEMV